MSTVTTGVKWLLAAVAVIAAAASAQAQWIKKPSDLDPFNKNGSIAKIAKELDKQKLNAIQGTPYRFTLKNPTSKGIHFTINGKPFLVMGHHTMTISGRGTPEIRFSYGVDGGAFKYYHLSSGQSYVFRWKRESVGEYGVINTLDLYRD